MTEINPVFKFYCETCNFKTNRKSQYDEHITTEKHKIALNPETSAFVCELCNYSVYRKSQYDRHLLTPKHIRLASSECDMECENCQKKYKNPASLNKHKLKCKSSNELIIEILKEVVIAQHKNADFQQQYTDLQKQMLEQQSRLIELSGKAGSSITTANSYNNNTFNVNMFLNEYCKNAVTIESFIDSIETTRDDVMYLTRHGNKAGMTKIITSALGQLGVTERPIHCTDLKRHTTYIKDSEGWNKEQAEEKLRRLLCNTQHKCLQRAIEILDSNPNYQKNGTPEYEERIKMMSEVTSDEGEEHVLRKIQETAQLNREIATSGQCVAVLTV